MKLGKRKNADRRNNTCNLKPAVLSVVAGCFVITLFSSLMRMGTTEDMTSLSSSKHAANFDYCQRKLDQLDAEFNRRRTIRQQIVANTTTVDGPKTAYDLFEPESTCFTDERFGSIPRYAAFGDGPKFICGTDWIASKHQRQQEQQLLPTQKLNNSNETSCLVYSIGSNNDIQFEMAVSEFLQCETHTFDPTLGSPFVGDEYATFHPWGIGVDGEEGKVGDKTWKGKSFETVITELGHLGRTIDILKIDCEGCEYTSLPGLFQMIVDQKIVVNQLQVEIHGTDFTKIAGLFASADKAKMRIFHKERNHWGCDGFRCLEYALASESFLREVNGATICPDF